MMIYRNHAADGAVRCGNRKAHGDSYTYHANAAAVRACFVGDGVCDWLLDLGAHPEDGDAMVMECGFALHITDRGWTCDNGHSHVTAEVRHDEGWDYAHDAVEAGQLAKVGVRAVTMDGTQAISPVSS